MDEFDILTTKTNKWEEKINDGSLTIEEINRIYNNLRTDTTQLCRAALCTNLNRITISEMRALTERIERTKRAARRSSQRDRRRLLTEPGQYDTDADTDG